MRLLLTRPHNDDKVIKRCSRLKQRHDNIITSTGNILVNVQPLMKISHVETGRLTVQTLPAPAAPPSTFHLTPVEQPQPTFLTPQIPNKHKNTSHPPLGKRADGGAPHSDAAVSAPQIMTHSDRADFERARGVASSVKPVHAWLRSTNPLPPENRLFLPNSLEIRVPPWMRRTTVSTPPQLVCIDRVQLTGPGLNSPLQNFTPASPQRRLSPSTCAAPSVRKTGGKVRSLRFNVQINK
ncbi:unnamed protein product [Pleuronectes platessa]|uniref:Uncharacterized protein n=1 Tax=Pleuronectes platessa TaxID=8262 RepID=A0A9N7VWQ2_PLEPL|nr:unnamed protein product [Pleuronectes platessa]